MRRLFTITALTAGVTALLLWSLQKEYKPSNWVETVTDKQLKCIEYGSNGRTRNQD